MGNKSKILNRIYDEAQQIAPQSKVFFDAFSGTTNVGQRFKKYGYKVISNDINTTSYLLGKVYLGLNDLPKFTKLFQSNCYSIAKIEEFKQSGKLDELIEEFILLNRGTNNEVYMRSIINSNALQLLAYLSLVADEKDISYGEYNYQLKAPDFIWRNFCVKGTNSRYFNLVSQKSIISQVETLERVYQKKPVPYIQTVIGLLKQVYEPPYNLSALEKAIDVLRKNTFEDNTLTTVLAKLDRLSKRKNHIGNRMFFSEVHGRKIDVINNLNLLWVRDQLITEEEYNYLQCALVEAIALFSNTSATYQAFYKTYRDNTKQTFRLVVPEITASSQEHLIYCQDTFQLIEELPVFCDILYLDPPYNWRIYDSNYHLLNLVSDFNNLADHILDYESGIAGAAGENRTLVREYTNYNRRNTFEDLLFSLIQKANCRYVIISYSDSLSNHNKNSLSSVEKIQQFLSDPEFFVPDSFKKVEVRSQNFESRKSKNKEKINELLFIAEKRGATQ